MTDQNGMSMPVSQNGTSVPIQSSTPVEISGNPRESSRGLTEQSVTDRIRILASQGLKVRDISSMLHIHPQLVLLLLDEGGR